MLDRVFKIKLLSPDAIVPTKIGATWQLYADSFAHAGMQDVTFDLGKSFYGNKLNGEAAKYGYILQPRGRILVRTGLSFESTPEYAAEILHMLKPTPTALHCQGLLIEHKFIFDMDEIDFVAINLGHKPIEIKKGEAVAQMLITSVNPAQIQIIN